MPVSSAPKIELHVHLEGTVRAHALLQIARRNGVALPVDNVEELANLYEFTDFDHFIRLWMMTTHAIHTAADFRQVVVSYAEEAAAHGAIYIEGIFTPAERISGGASWDEVFTGFCDGADEAKATHGVEVRLTPDIPRSFGLDAAMETVRYSIKYRERGVVGVGLGGREAEFPPEPFELAFRVAKDGGLGSVPHAGEVSGVESIRGAIDVLRADRLRHGVRAIDDPGLLREIAARGIVCDVCPVSNLRTRVFASLETHPLPAMMAAGVLCSISTDDPAMFDTDLTREYEVAALLGCSPADAFRAGMLGALCDDRTRAFLVDVSEGYSWAE
jgi:aminodeoxyfutalosine deaminase